MYYDTEFLENGSTVRLISIGMVTDDGRELYRVARDPALITAAWEHPWLRENVIPSLPVKAHPYGHGGWIWDREHPDWPNVAHREDIAIAVRDFIVAVPDPQLWAWYGAYDHVALCQLFGPMSSLPDGVPMWTNDLKQECVRLGDPMVPPMPAGEHNALADARHNKLIARFLGAIREGITSNAD
ncbi:MAG: hypothetical protein JWO67_2268 [Streptosporangiaceae bacterium]|nr:hypothetical protein [Streptosporangiaceae bacterium]